MKIFLTVISFSSLFLRPSSSYITEKQYLSMPKIFQLDDYNSCLLPGPEQSLYCLVKLQLRPQNSSHVSESWKFIERVSRNKRNPQHDLLFRGVCLSNNAGMTRPESENNYEKLIRQLNRHYNEELSKFGVQTSIVKVRCESEKYSYPMSGSDKLFLYIISSCFLLVLLVSFYDFLSEEKTPRGDFVQAISLQRNWNRLTEVNFKTKADEDLRFMQGFRVYGSLFVLFAHVFFTSFDGPITNTYNLSDVPFNEHNTYPALEGAYVMQMFFMLSGWLSTYNFLKKYDDQDVINVEYFVKTVIQRYIRLTPLVAIATFFLTSVLIQMGSGPMWYEYVNESVEACATGWWVNLTYLLNFFMSNAGCLPHLWFLTVSNQVFLFGLVLTFFMWKYAKYRKLFPGFVIVFQVAQLFLIYYETGWEQKYRSVTPIVPFRNQAEDFINSAFNIGSLHTNAGSYFLGFIFGCVFYESRQKQLTFKKIHVLIWWMLIITIPVCHILIDHNIHFDRTLNALYGSTKRLSFATASALMLLGIIKGLGKVLQWFNGSVPIIILGRLTYAVYVFHPLVQLARLGSNSTEHYIGLYNLIFANYISDVVLSFGVALVLSLFIEMPIKELEQRFLHLPKYRFLDLRRKPDTNEERCNKKEK